MYNQDGSELSELEREYIANDVLVVKEAIAQFTNMKGDNKNENHQRIMAESHSKSNVNRLSKGTL